MNINRRLLLHGAIRKDRGNGLQFYTALEAASVDDLRSALVALNAKYGDALYTYRNQRAGNIERRIKELEATTA